MHQLHLRLLLLLLLGLLLEMSWIIVLPSHSCRVAGHFTKSTSKTVAQLNADVCRPQRQVSRMTDEKGETWSPFGMSKVRSRPESLESSHRADVKL